MEPLALRYAVCAYAVCKGVVAPTANPRQEPFLNGRPTQRVSGSDHHFHDIPSVPGPARGEGEVAEAVGDPALLRTFSTSERFDMVERQIAGVDR